MTSAPARTVIVMAKAPCAGRSKTRLCPPCTPNQAAALAEAALTDTLETVLRSAADRRVLALDGVPGRWLPGGFVVVAQRGEAFGDRLAGAFADAQGAAPGPTVLVGMDTPQMAPSHLDRAFELLDGRAATAVLGPALDGGWWLLGLPRPDGRVFSGVPMSTAETGERQRRRLTDLGYEIDLLPALRDVDRWPDAQAVARLVPRTHFGRQVSAMAA
jgi:rSAM/selenodomain-associated transferase 1